MAMKFDRENNWECKNCIDCKDCANCTDCKNCNEFSRYCKGCENCEGCSLCTDCKGCTNCTNCTGLVDCKDYENNKPRVHGIMVYSLFSDGGGDGFGVFSSYATLAKYIAGQMDWTESEVLADLEAKGQCPGYYIVAGELDCPDCFDI